MVSTRRSSARDARRQQGEQLRQQATGLGVAVLDDDEVKKNHKILFDEDAGVALADHDDEIDKQKVHENNDEGDDESSIEEVPASLAQQLALEQNEQATTAAAAATTTAPRKKKRKRLDRDEIQLDAAFFKRLAQEEEQHRSEMAEKARRRQRQHTSFVVTADDANVAPQKTVSHGIEVVVLSRNSLAGHSVPSTTTTAASQRTLTYARRNLVDGRDVTPDKKNKKNAVAADTFWQRSSKMKRPIGGQKWSAATRRAGKGSAAPMFVVKKKPTAGPSDRTA